MSLATSLRSRLVSFVGSNVTFAFIAEAGSLEQQARLLVASIRRFAGRHGDARIVVISPRADRRPSDVAIRAFAKADVEYVETDVKSVVPEYGTSYRVHVAATIERQCDSTLVFLDSDIFFAGEPDLGVGDFSAAARPVDVKGMCSMGATDPCDTYWRELCAVSGVDYDRIPVLTTTVDRTSVKASYNGGFVVVRAGDAVLQHTEEFFIRSVEAGLMPWHDGMEVRAAHGLVTGKGARFWGSSQACLSLAAWGRGRGVRVLPPSHNFPINNDGYVTERGMSEPIVAAHYHHLFGPDGDAALHRRLNVPPSCLQWLEESLPLAC